MTHVDVAEDRKTMAILALNAAVTELVSVLSDAFDEVTDLEVAVGCLQQDLEERDEVVADLRGALRRMAGELQTVRNQRDTATVKDHR